MYLSLLILPLLSASLGGLAGRFLGATGIYWVSCLCLSTASLLATLAFYEVGWGGSSVSLYGTLWIDSDWLTIPWELLFDPLTVSMALPVLYISTVVHLFSVGYMSADPHPQRFFAYLSLFTFFMLLLVTGGNYLVLFVGWEGIGVVSYLLINFWFTRLQATKAALLALVTNRIGDMGFSVGLFATLALFRSVDYATLSILSPLVNGGAVTSIALLFLIGAMAKSAQIPLHGWLPGSMEGPTPVSALIHAATLVTAGLYLLIRSSFLLEYSPTALLIVTLVGATTALFAATCGLVQNDLKRIVAFSTISQLGYMVMAVGIGRYDVALMHVVNHAFFKALLFLGAGAVIHGVSDQQDVRRMGGLAPFLPFTYVALSIGTVALLGLPWLSGFYSKDLIIESAYARYSFGGSYAYLLGSVTAGLTAFYSSRLIAWTFFTAPQGNVSLYRQVHEPPFTIVIPLALLALFSVGFGFSMADLFVGLGSPFFGSALSVSPDSLSAVESEFGLPLTVKTLPTALSLLGVAIAIVSYRRGGLFSSLITGGSLPLFLVYRFFNVKYGWDAVCNRYVVQRGLRWGYRVVYGLDRGALEMVGPHGLGVTFHRIGGYVARWDTGTVTDYALYVVIGVLTFLTFGIVV